MKVWVWTDDLDLWDGIPLYDGRQGAITFRDGIWGDVGLEESGVIRLEESSFRDEEDARAFLVRALSSIPPGISRHVLVHISMTRMKIGCWTAKNGHFGDSGTLLSGSPEEVAASFFAHYRIGLVMEG